MSPPNVRERPPYRVRWVTGTESPANGDVDPSEGLPLGGARWPLSPTELLGLAGGLAELWPLPLPRSLLWSLVQTAVTLGTHLSWTP